MLKVGKLRQMATDNINVCETFFTVWIVVHYLKLGYFQPGDVISQEKRENDNIYLLFRSLTIVLLLPLRQNNGPIQHI